MRINTARVSELCRKRQLPLSRVLSNAKISRNAFYTQARKSSVLPRSIHALAAELGVDPSDLLTDPGSLEHQTRRLLARVDRIAQRHPSADRDTIRHTLLLCEEKPVDRLRRALLRGRKVDIHG